ncbi:MAG: hypothetical protein U5N55_13865 [Cypionkella sp.]|nr:hypothetical protein [Cypionkella sp.]
MITGTTDEFGRFNVPCADLPRDIGSNFLLKLDERSLPTGYRMTTENPRVMRLTAGKMIEMNFGATISRIVRIEVTDGAFETVDGKVQMRSDFVEGVSNSLGGRRSTPSNLRIIYTLGADGERAANQRMASVVG